VLSSLSGPLSGNRHEIVDVVREQDATVLGRLRELIFVVGVKQASVSGC